MWILLFHGHFSNDTENENKSNPNINFKLMYMKQSMKSKGFERRLLLIMWGLFLSLSAFAQQISIKGHVVDATGEPVIGASVVEGRTTNGTITDVDGNFSLSVPANSTLTISFVGYKTQTVPVNGKNSLKVTLQEDTEVLDEVVVVGYGTMKKSDLTGAVSSVGVKDIKDSPVANIGQAMQGKVSGVQIIDAGKPGDNVTIKIRGLGTINNSNPLIVIDGIPTDLGLSSLNMADVERVDVLKDASATAIYGSRGANGVVMITSKRGAEGAGKVTVNANWAIQNATKVPDMLNAAQYAALSNDMLSNNDDNTNPYWADPSLLGTGTNWLDEMLRTGVKQSYSVSYSGGTEKAHYYVSGGFLDQSGIVESVNYRRFNFQANSDAQVNKWLKFTTNLTFSTDVKEGGSYSIGDAMKALPIQPVKNEDGSWSGPGQEAQWYGSVRNPIGTLYMMTNETKGYNFLANITGEIAFTKWLKLKSTFGYDAKFWFVDNFTPAYDWKPNPVEESSRYKSDNKSFTYLWDNYFVFYGYVTDGLFQNWEEVNRHATQPGAAPGDIRFRDLNNDGVINDEDRTVIGNPNPNWFFSLSNNFSYKGWELSVFLQGVSGNKIYNANNVDNEGMAAAYNQTTAVLNRWTGEGTSNSMPRAIWGDPNQNCRVSDRFVENGSYLRLKNITLSYTLPKKWMQKIQLENARISFSCENVATITGYSGFDPEVDINGIDSSRYPISRTFSMGLNFNF